MVYFSRVGDLLPVETWVSLPHGLWSPFYIVDLIAMAFLLWGAVRSLRARPERSPAILCAAYAWTVANGAKGEAGSRIGVLFDTLKQGDVTIPVQASIVSVVNAATRATVANNDLWADSNTSASGSAQTTSNASSGGLLGGVTQTAGGVLNTATTTVGGVANSARSTVGSTVGGVTNSAGSTVNSLGRVQVMQSTDALANGSSTLSLTGGNLKLEKGTTFNVALSSSAQAGN